MKAIKENKIEASEVDVSSVRVWLKMRGTTTSLAEAAEEVQSFKARALDIATAFRDAFWAVFLWRFGPRWAKNSCARGVSSHPLGVFAAKEPWEDDFEFSGEMLEMKRPSRS